MHFQRSAARYVTAIKSAPTAAARAPALPLTRYFVGLASVPRTLQKYGYCGTSPEYCSPSNGCQPSKAFKFMTASCVLGDCDCLSGAAACAGGLCFLSESESSRWDVCESRRTRVAHVGHAWVGPALVLKHTCFLFFGEACSAVGIVGSDVWACLERQLAHLRPASKNRCLPFLFFVGLLFSPRPSWDSDSLRALRCRHQLCQFIL